MSKIDYKGGRWLKCDFHLHTPASLCFKEREVTAEQWVDRCLEQKLDCVAVTDHNTGEWIDKIKSVSEQKGLIVFPGVEITCDTAKVHLLILFDRDKNTTYVEDFLIECGITRPEFAQTTACSQKTCLEIADIAAKHGAVVIPAHIDEFNGLGCISKASVSSMFAKQNVNAAQYVYGDFVQPKLSIDADTVSSYNASYRNPNPAIGMDTIKGYYYCVQEAVKKNICLVTFSDNPDDVTSSKHSLSGIGKRYTWIKLDKNPTLESVRQAFLFPERVKNCFDYQFSPYKEPELWIRSIEIQDTLLTKTPLKVEFNPQLNTIIGGRGSGKSSIFRFLRGAFNKIKDIQGLPEIKEEQEQFFRKPQQDKGVLKEESVIVVEFVREGNVFKVTYNKDGLDIQKQDKDTWVKVTDKNYVQFFAFEQYTQKQVFAISKNTNALRELIDSSSESIKRMKEEKLQLINDYITAKQQLKQAKASKSRIDMLDTEIKDLKQKIDSFKSSNIADIVKRQELFSKQQTAIEAFFLVLQTKIENIVKASDSFNIGLDYNQFNESHKAEIEALVAPILSEIKQWASGIHESGFLYKRKILETYQKLQETAFEKDKIAHNELLVKTQEELEKSGINEISSFQEYSNRLQTKEKEKEELLHTASQVPIIETRLNSILDAIYARTQEITDRRQSIVDELSTDKVQVLVLSKSDESKFIRQFREIIQKDKSYDSDINIVRTTCFPQKPVDFRQAYSGVINDLYKQKDGGSSQLGFDGYFSRITKTLDDEQWARLETLIPDDNIDVKYKPNGSSHFKSIVSASAGQKTTAVLTFILSQGKLPLLLDQPEDDLDNRLVCDLIVEKIKKIKNHRQIIVITHNANIPVIGDAEYIVSMDSSSRYLKVHSEGMLENKDVKTEICEIMEGGEDAFKLRAERYGNI